MIEDPEDSERLYYPVTSQRTIQEILEVILSHPHLNTQRAEKRHYDVHYCGFADEGLIRAMMNHARQFTFSLLDIPDRWGSNMSFWWDDDYPNEPCPEAPAWLDGVVFYMEGAPFSEIWLWDSPWQRETQLHEIIHFFRPPAAIIILFGHADMDTDHPAYDWKNIGTLRIGYWKGGPAPAGERKAFLLENPDIVGIRSEKIPNSSTRIVSSS